MNFTIVEMKEADWQQVSEIYAAGIKTKIATFQNEVPSWEEWDKGHSLNCRFVARSGEQILGWAALSPISSRCVYAGVGEVSIYIGDKYRGIGVGTTLLNHLVRCSEEKGYWTIQAGIIKENLTSRSLHKKCGFREIGYRERLGRMDTGKWHDVILMERRSTLTGNES